MWVAKGFIPFVVPLPYRASEEVMLSEHKHLSKSRLHRVNRNVTQSHLDRARSDLYLENFITRVATLKIKHSITLLMTSQHPHPIKHVKRPNRIPNRMETVL